MSKTHQANILEMLKTGGANITKPLKFEFFLYLTTKLNATKAAAKLRRGGFSVKQVSQNSSKPRWLCLAKKTIVPKQADFADYNRFFNQVAEDLNGEYKGWEAEIVD